MQDDKVEVKTNNYQGKQTFGYAKYWAMLIIIAVIFFYAGCVYKSRNIQISYISQGEILALEKQRVSTYNIKDRQLFFGKPADAIKHIEQIQQDMSKNGSIILLTDSKIYANNIASISQEVHQKIIDRLRE